MKFPAIWSLGMLCLLAMVTPSVAQDAAAGKVTIDSAYAFAVPPGARSAAAFMTLHYAPFSGQGDDLVPDRLIGVQTPIAGRSEIHTVLIDNNTMMMRQVSALPLPPMGSFTFSPQGSHIMMMELRQPLVAGESFPMTLTFEKAGAVEVSIPVRPAGDIPKQADAMLTKSTPAAATDPELISEPPEERGVHEDLENLLEKEIKH